MTSKNKQIAAVAAAMCSLASNEATCALPSQNSMQQESPHPILLQKEELKSWVDKDKTMIILDARTAQYDDGTRIPKAKSVPYDATTDIIYKAVPTKEITVVVYCSNQECRASGRLADRLLKMGYKKVYEYSAGIADWVKAGYPVDHVQ